MLLKKKSKPCCFEITLLRHRLETKSSNMHETNTDSDSSVQIESHQASDIVEPRTWTGYAFAFLSAVILATGGLFVKLSEGEKVKVASLRCIIQYAIFLPTITVKKLSLWGKDTKTTMLLLLRGILSGVAMTCSMLCIQHLPLGDSVAVTYSYPPLVFLFACVLLKEKCGVFNLILTIITLVGLVFIAQPSFLFKNATKYENNISEGDRVTGVLLGFTASTTLALISVIIRKLGPGIHFSVSLFHSSWEGLIVLSAYLIITENLSLSCLNGLPVMLAAAAALLSGQVLTTMALQRERAGPIALIKTSQVLFSFAFQYFALDVRPTVLSAVGAALILSSTIFVSIKNIWKNNRNSKPLKT